MNNKLYHDELEGFLSESAEELRMYPSDRVWRNINKEIQGDKQWPALTFGAIFTGALMLAALIFLQPDKDLFTVKHSAPLGHIPVVAKPAFKVAGNSNSITNNFEPQASSTHIHTPRALAHTAVEDEVLNSAVINVAPLPTPVEVSAVQAGISLTTTTIEEPSNFSLTDYLYANAVTPHNTVAIDINSNQAIADDATASLSNTVTEKSTAIASTVDRLSKKKSRWAVQYYATPSMSYRFLSEEKTALATALTSNPNTLGAMVKHTPKTGIEAGIAFSYQVTENLRVKMGVQANYRRYAIEAYSAAPQPALIMINQGMRMDTMVAMTDVSNVSGGKPMQVSNELLQVSAPIGFELQMARFNQARFVVAATIQPTYNIGQQSWLISADYLSYVKQPSLLRKWNVNTGVEAFMQFNGKKGTSWQVGPQIRYQLLPGAVRSYPVREHLIDYGLKIGFVKTLQ